MTFHCCRSLHHLGECIPARQDSESLYHLGGYGSVDALQVSLLVQCANMNVVTWTRSCPLYAFLLCILMAHVFFPLPWGVMMLFFVPWWISMIFVPILMMSFDLPWRHRVRWQAGWPYVPSFMATGFIIKCNLLETINVELGPWII